MLEDILVILLVVFGLFAIVMFVLLYTFIKKRHNIKRISDDYRKSDDDNDEPDDDEPNNEEVTPKKKKQ